MNYIISCEPQKPYSQFVLFDQKGHLSHRTLAEQDANRLFLDSHLEGALCFPVKCGQPGLDHGRD
jgi:hypothetical protein